MKRKILSFALAAVMVVALAPVTNVFAAVSCKEIVPPTYDAVGNFNEGLATVELNGKWGAIDRAGKVIVSPTYDAIGKTYGSAGKFSDGVAFIELGGKWGLIDSTGKVLTFPKYDDVNNFSEGMAAVELNGLWGYIDLTGNEVIPAVYTYADNFQDGVATAALSDDDWFVIDITGNKVNYTPAPTEGLTQYYDSDSGLSGYQDGDGNIVIEPQYTTVDYSFTDGVAVVNNADGAGLIDESGNEIVPCGKYIQINAFVDGMAEVHVADSSFGLGYRCGFINIAGDEVVPAKYAYVESFSDGMALVRDTNWEYGFVDKNGKEIVPLKYSQAKSFSNGFAAIGIQISGGQTSTTSVNNGITVNASSYTAPVNKYGFIDTTGNEVIPPQYDLVGDVSEGMAAFATGDWQQAQNYDGLELSNAKWGFISINPIATPTASKVLVNGAAISFDAYNIDGNNYFKLRDLAYVLSGTEKQFEVGWDGVNNAISLTSGEAYTATGGELAANATPTSKTATPTTSKIYLDGKEVSFTAYNIDGNNYFKLRDVMQTFNVGVGWDGATSTITINTTASYVQ